MSAAELQLHDIDKLNNIVNTKLKKFVADLTTNKTPLTPEVKEVLNSKIQGKLFSYEDIFVFLILTSPFQCIIAGSHGYLCFGWQ